MKGTKKLNETSYYELPKQPNNRKNHIRGHKASAPPDLKQTVVNADHSTNYNFFITSEKNTLDLIQGQSLLQKANANPVNQRTVLALNGVEP